MSNSIGALHPPFKLSSLVFFSYTILSMHEIFHLAGSRQPLSELLISDDT